jgi:hypothetical protein
VDPSTYAVKARTFGDLFWTDLAVSADGNQFAAVNTPPFANGSGQSRQRSHAMLWVIPFLPFPPPD